MLRVATLASLAASLVVGCSAPSGSVTPTVEALTATPPPTIAPPRPTPTTQPSPHGAFPAQPAGVPFPDSEWPEGEWPAGVDRRAIDDAVEVAFADGAATRMRAVVVIHKGTLIYERYSPNLEDGRGKIMPAYSMSKSFLVTLVGILVRDGKLDIFAPAPISEWSDPEDPRRAITIDHLLRMTAGLDLSGPPYPDPDSDFARMLGAEDAPAYAADKRLEHPPGTEFAYTDVNGVLVGGLMADIVGGGYAFKDFARTELFDEIAINRIDLRLDASGNWIASVFADTTARNYVKLGLLYLRDGVWDGERILPEGWVDYVRTPTAANPEYGAGWWLDLVRPGVFYAIGHNGQAMAVDPVHDLTYVTLATDGKMSLPVGEAIQQAFEAAE